MARLYVRSDSPFWYLEYRTLDSIQRDSTGIRHGTREGQRAANKLLHQKQADEKALSNVPAGSAFQQWVMPFLRQHCINSKLTFMIYRRRWDVLEMFMRERGIRHPCELAYNHAFEFLDWRVGGGAGKPVQHNTAKDDLDTLRMLMNEAVRREFCPSNPLLRLRLKAAKRKERPELTEEQIANVRHALRHGDWPSFMLIQFEIALHTGRRISETKIPMSAIDLERGEYTVRVKGGNIRTKPIHPKLLPLLRTIKGEYTHTASRGYSSVVWRKFFDSLGMPEHSFHGIRNTVISRARRAGVDRWTLMQVVDHATVAINAHYDRFAEADLRGALAKLKFPAPRKCN